MANRWETTKTVTDFIFLGPKSLQMVTVSHEIKRHLLLGRKAMTNLDNVLIKKQKHYFAIKGPYRQSCGFSCSYVWMWVLDNKEGWAPKNWCFCTVVLEKTLESPLEYKEIKPVNPEGNQPWIFIRRTNAETKAQYFGHMMWRTDSLEKTLMLGKIEGGRRRGWHRMDGWMAAAAAAKSL